MKSDTSEGGLEALIVADMTDTRGVQLVASTLNEPSDQFASLRNWQIGDPKDYDRAWTLDLVQFTDFIRATQPALMVTADEKKQMFRELRSAYWKSLALLWICMTAAVLLMIGVAVTQDAPEKTVTAVTYCLAALFVPAAFLMQRRISQKAENVIGSRPAVRSARTWRQVQDERLATTAWWRVLTGGLVLGILAWLFLPTAASAVWIWLAWTGYFGFCFVMWSRNVWRKLNSAKPN